MLLHIARQFYRMAFLPLRVLRSRATIRGWSGSVLVGLVVLAWLSILDRRYHLFSLSYTTWLQSPIISLITRTHALAWLAHPIVLFLPCPFITYCLHHIILFNSRVVDFLYSILSNTLFNIQRLFYLLRLSVCLRTCESCSGLFLVYSCMWWRGEWVMVRKMDGRWQE